MKQCCFLYFHDWTSRCKCMFFVQREESERLLEYFRNWHYSERRRDYLEWFHDNLQFIVLSPCMAFRPAPLDQDRYEKVSILCNLRSCKIVLLIGFMASANAFSLVRFCFGKCTQIPNFEIICASIFYLHLKKMAKSRSFPTVSIFECWQNIFLK